MNPIVEIASMPGRDGVVAEILSGDEMVFATVAASTMPAYAWAETALFYDGGQPVAAIESAKGSSEGTNKVAGDG